MSDHAAAPAAETSGLLLLERHHFLLRRLHSLTGIVPIGAFVTFHLFTNMQMLFGTFQHEVNWIHSQPALLFMEIGVLWLPIAFHAGLGVWYTFSGRPNTIHYRYGGNLRYLLQRVTGIIALGFIFLHVATLRWRWDLLGWYSPFFSKGVGADNVVVDLAHYSTSVALAHPLILALYIVGVGSAIFHWANGLWTAAITWGATVTVQAQRRWGYLCAAIGLALAGFAAAALLGAVTYRDHAPEAQKAAYARMAQDYKAGRLDFEQLEELAVTPSGAVLKGGH